MKIKSRDKCFEKYGIEWYTKTEEYKERYKNTCLEKYGVENIFQNEDIKIDIKEKSRKTKIERGRKTENEFLIYNSNKNNKQHENKEG